MSCEVINCTRTNIELREPRLCAAHRSLYKKYGKIIDRTNREPHQVVVEGDTAVLFAMNRQNEVIGKILVDVEDVDRVVRYRWNISDGYAKSRKYPGGHAGLHNFILGASYVDHINHNGLDNRKANLRVSTHQQNMANMKLSKKNVSGYMGVSFDSFNNKWRAVVFYCGTRINLGRYRTPEEAAYIRDQVALQVNGEFANLNFEIV